MTEPAKKKALSERDIITGDVRLSFPNLFAPRGIKGVADSVPKFQCSLLLPPKTDLKPYIAAIKAAMLDKWGKVLTLPGDKNPLRDCATYAYKSQRYAGYDDGWIFLRCASTYQPPVVDRMNLPVTDPTKAYPGVWVRAFLNAFAWTHPTGGRGVGFGLSAIQIVRVGERLDSRRDPSEVFTALGDVDFVGEPTTEVDLGGVFG